MTNTPQSKVSPRWLWFAALSACMTLIALQLLPQAQTDIETRTRNHAIALARSLAHQARNGNKIDATSAQSWIKSIQSQNKYIGAFQDAMVLFEKAGEDLGFGLPLRETLFAAHTNPKRQGKPLDKASKRDKQLFDLTQNLDKASKTNPALVNVQHLAKSKSFIVAAPILGTNKAYLGSAIVRVPYLAPLTFSTKGTALSYWLSWLLGIALVGVMLYLVRGPWGHMFPLVGLVAISLYPYVNTVEYERQQRLARLQYEVTSLNRILKQTRPVSPSWLRATASQSIRQLPQKQAGKQWFLSLNPEQIKARPGHIKSWPYIALGLAGLFIYMLFAWGFLGSLGRTILQHRAAYLYTSPAIGGMLLLVFAPFAVGIGLSFFQHTGGGNYVFVGLKHFKDLFASQLHPFPSPLSFYFTLTVTILWTVSNVALHVGIGLALALLLKNPLLRLKEVYRVLLILPWAIPNYITALIWKGMFHQQFGAINAFYSSIGLTKVQWFSHFSTAFTANLVTNTWLGFPFMMVVSLGALQSIPGDLYEAADVDGANGWQKFWYITMPLLKPALFPAIILGSIWTFNMFNVIYLVSGGGPDGSTDILLTEAYHWAFTRGNHYGYAAAYSVLIFLILLGYSLATNKITKATEGIFTD
jgi:ABC-type sugar transport system permease subunit